MLTFDEVTNIRSGMLLEKLTVYQLVRNSSSSLKIEMSPSFLHFINTKIRLATEIYPVLCTLTPFFVKIDFNLILSSPLFLQILFSESFPIKILYTLACSFSQFVPHDSPIPSFCTLSHSSILRIAENDVN